MPKIERLKIIVAKIDEGTLDKPQLTVEIEPEIFEWAKFITEKVIPRYGKDHWQEDQEDKNFFGYLGQKIFESILLELKIPHLHADPLYRDFKVFRSLKMRPFDFYIPELGTFEVKATPPGEKYTRFLANVRRWQREKGEYAVAIKTDSIESKEAHLCGYLYGYEVEQLPIRDFGKGLAYWTFLNPTSGYKRLRPSSELIELIRKHSIKL